MTRPQLRCLAVFLGALLAGGVAGPSQASASPAADRAANRLLNKAMQELARYELEEAVATLGDVLEITPNDGFAHSRLAEVLAVGLGRGPEMSASYRALTEAQPERPILRVWVVRAEIARHVTDRWIVESRPWVAQALAELDRLTSDDQPAEVRFAAFIAIRDLRMRMNDADEAASAGAAATMIFPNRLQARVSSMLAARRSGESPRLRTLCRDVIRATPGAVEACSMLFTGSSWTDQDTLETDRAAVLADVAKLGDRVLGDPVLAHEVVKFYGRAGVPEGLQADYLARVMGRHSQFRLAVGARWWRSAPPPLDTSLRRIREAQAAALARMPPTPRDAPWILEEQASRAARDGDREEALRLIRSASLALVDVPYTPTASRPTVSFHRWSQDRTRDLGRMLALEARILRGLERADEAWPVAHRAAWLHDDGHTWIDLAQFAAVRGEAEIAVEADLEGLSRFGQAELAALPQEYRTKAAERFTAAHPHVAIAKDHAWAVLLAAVGARRTGRSGDQTRTGEPDIEGHPLVGRPAPPIEVTTLGGIRLSPTELEGRVVVVDFWATWCAPCKRVMPELQAARDHLDDRVVILALSVDEGLAEVEAFMTDSLYSFDVAHVGPAGQLPWLVDGIPSTFVIDGQGTVRHHHQGYERGVGRRLEEQVRALLAKD